MQGNTQQLSQVRPLDIIPPAPSFSYLSAVSASCSACLRKFIDVFICASLDGVSTLILQRFFSSKSAVYFCSYSLFQFMVQLRYNWITGGIHLAWSNRDSISPLLGYQGTVVMLIVNLSVSEWSWANVVKLKLSLLRFTMNKLNNERSNS